MSNQGNEQNMDKVKELMEKAQQVNLAGDLKEGVYIDYTTAFGTNVKGNVIFKRPTMKDYMRMGAIKSEELRKAGVRDVNLVDNTIKFMAHVISTLSVVVVKSPEWLLKLEEVQEPDILYHVYAKYEEWEESFRKDVTPSTSGDSTASE